MPAAIRPPKTKDYLVLGLCAALLASSFGAISITLASLHPLHLATMRCVIAACALWLWSHRRVGSKDKSETPPLSSPSPPTTKTLRTWPHLLAVGFFGYAAPFSLLAWAETTLGPGHTAMLFCSGPIFAVLIAWLWQKDEKSSPWIFGGMALCTLGIAMMVLPPTPEGPNPKLLAAGAVLACALSYAISGICTRKAPLASEALTRKSLGYASVMMLSLCLALALPWPQATPITWAACLYLGLVPTALCSLLRYRQIQELGYTFVSQTGYLVPTIGALIGLAFFDESMNLIQFGGLMLSMLGLAWSKKTLSPLL